MSSYEMASFLKARLQADATLALEKELDRREDDKRRSIGRSATTTPNSTPVSSSIAGSLPKNNSPAVGSVGFAQTRDRASSRASLPSPSAADALAASTSPSGSSIPNKSPSYSSSFSSGSLSGSLIRKSQLEGWSSGPNSVARQSASSSSALPVLSASQSNSSLPPKGIVIGPAPVSSSTLIFEKIRVPADDEPASNPASAGASPLLSSQPPAPASSSPIVPLPTPLSLGPIPASNGPAILPISPTPAPAAESSQTTPVEATSGENRPKKASEMTKAERRAMQEAQRAKKNEIRAEKGLPPTGKGETSKPKASVLEQQQQEQAAAAAVSAPAPAAPAAAQTPAEEDGARKSKTKSSVAPPPAQMQYDDAKKAAKKSKKSTVRKDTDIPTHPFFSHLPQFIHVSSSSIYPWAERLLHPAVHTLGLKFANNVISGANARCTAMLFAFRDVIRDFTQDMVPPTIAASGSSSSSSAAPGNRENESASRDIEAVINAQIQFLVDCRPQSVSMGNAVKWLKVQLHELDKVENISIIKETLISRINDYIYTRIVSSTGLIVRDSLESEKIKNGDVILTYARSFAVEQLLKKAHAKGLDFSVVIVDSRPRYEGRALLKRLTSAGIKCSYALLEFVSHMMKNVTKVFIGASTLLSNGNVISRVGSASVACVAKSYQKPVIVFCETYKFSERIHLDSFGSNELGNPDDLVTVPGSSESGKLASWKDQGGTLQLLNLQYDLTPARFIDMVATEIGFLPPSAVPCVIREYLKELTY